MKNFFQALFGRPQNNLTRPQATTLLNQSLLDDLLKAQAAGQNMAPSMNPMGGISGAQKDQQANMTMPSFAMSALNPTNAMATAARGGAPTGGGISGDKGAQVRGGLLSSLSQPQPQTQQGLLGLMNNPMFALGTALLNPRQSIGQNLQQGFQNIMQQQMYQQQMERQKALDELAFRKADTADVVAQAQLASATRADLPKPTEVTVNGVKQLASWDKKSGTWRDAKGSPITGKVELVRTDALARNMELLGYDPNTPIEQIPSNIIDKLMNKDTINITNQKFDTKDQVYTRSKDTIEYVNKQTADFEKSKDFKEFKDSMYNYDLVKYNATNPTALGDISLIFSFFKAIDPSSTVREGEFALASGATGFIPSVKRALNRFFTGEGLDDEARRVLVKQARAAVKGRGKNITDTLSGVQNRVDKRIQALPKDERQATDVKSTYFGQTFSNYEKILKDEELDLKSFFRGPQRVRPEIIESSKLIDAQIINANPNLPQDPRTIGKLFRVIDKEGNVIFQ